MTVISCQHYNDVVAKLHCSLCVYVNNDVHVSLLLHASAALSVQ